jgi:hypothetical protein
MDGKIEQCVCIKFCMKLGKSATETSEMIRVAFGKQCLCQTTVSECHLHLKANSVLVENDERSEGPSTSKTTENVENIGELIHKGTHPRRPWPSNP